MVSYAFSYFTSCRYYPERCGLKNLVICDLQVFVDSILALINAVYCEKAISGEEHYLHISGNCSYKLLHRLLQNSSKQTLSTETLITLLEHMHLIVRTNNSAEEAPYSSQCLSTGGEESIEYFVPCVLRVFPVETILATVRGCPAPLLFTFENGCSPLHLFTQLYLYLISVEVKGWEPKRNSLYCNMVTFHVGKDLDEVTLIARPTFCEVVFEGDDTDRILPCHDACNHIRETIDDAIKKAKFRLSITARASHFATFYCPLRECCSNALHYVTIVGKKLICSASGRVGKITPPQQMWFGEVSTEYHNLIFFHQLCIRK